MNQRITTDYSNPSYTSESHPNASYLPLKRVKELTASVAHDLKNPLQSIAWLADYLRTTNSTADKQEQDESLTKILYCTREMNKLIECLLLDLPKPVASGQLVSEPLMIDQGRFSDNGQQADLSLIQSCSQDSTNPSTDLKDLLDSIQQVFVNEAPEIILHATENFIPVNERILRRIFHNLISNSIKHGNTFKCVITVKAQVKSDQTEITYEDNGPGLPTKSWNILLQPPQNQSEDYRNRSAGVSGNGLHIIRNLVTENGGVIRMGSKEGSSSIKLIFPFERQVKNSSHIPPWL